jgi:hypothetical protein
VNHVVFGTCSLDLANTCMQNNGKCQRTLLNLRTWNIGDFLFSSFPGLDSHFRGVVFILRIIPERNLHLSRAGVGYLSDSVNPELADSAQNAVSWAANAPR